MLIAIDVGNTNTVFAIFDGLSKKFEWRCSTDTQRTADQYFVWLKELMGLRNFDYKLLNAMVVSSVVPQVVFNLRILCRRYFNCRPLVVGKKECLLPIEIRVEQGVLVGADRIVNSAGAYNLYGGNLVIVDFGTATTFDIVDSDGAYIGGLIAPGVDLSVKALHEAAAALPHIDVTKPKTLIGKNTVECMQSGIFWGYLSLIEGIIQKIKIERNMPIKVIATGGLSTLFSQETQIFDIVDLDLTLSGLNYVYRYNNENKLNG